MANDRAQRATPHKLATCDVLGSIKREPDVEISQLGNEPAGAGEMLGWSFTPMSYSEPSGACRHSFHTPGVNSLSATKLTTPQSMQASLDLHEPWHRISSKRKQCLTPASLTLNDCFPCVSSFANSQENTLRDTRVQARKEGSLLHPWLHVHMSADMCTHISACKAGAATAWLS